MRADVTTVPIKTGEVNFSMGCYGCRSAGKLEDEEMYCVGIPIGKLDGVLKGLKGLRSGPWVSWTTTPHREEGIKERLCGLETPVVNTIKNGRPRSDMKLVARRPIYNSLPAAL
ncbi:MAG: DUF169 domain-containing protein [Chromatiales bacterium]|nr:DUF169 domain-containing protein [Chromatiales bacterium]